MKLAILTLAFLSIILSGCVLANIAAQQEKTTNLWDELVATETFGQSFISTQDNLYRIDLGTATYARTNSAPVIFHLRTSPETNTDIVSVTLSGADIQNERPTSFIFSPLPDSRGKTLYFFIESPEATPGNAITLYVNEYDQYPDGTAYKNGKPVTADLVFTAYGQETFTIASVLQDFLKRVAQDKPFLICYSLLLVGVCVGFVQILRSPDRR